MSAKLLIELLGQKITAELLTDKAPAICQALGECLPLESTAIHAKFAGRELIIMVPFFAEAENEILNVQPGDIGYYPGKQTICIFYGDITPFGKVSLFAKVSNGLEKMHAIGDYILGNGVTAARLSIDKGSDKK